ncbi:MAG: 3-oxoacyl-ACP reductase FabG [bacterium]
MKRLEKKAAVITGGASGIGKAAVLKFLSEGADIAVWDMDEAKGKELEVFAAENKYKLKFYKVNVANFDEVNEKAKMVIADFGQIDILVNNAGITRDASLKKMTPQQWQQVIDVNLTGVFNCTKIFAEYMLEQKSGKIINTSSVVGIYGNFGQTNYVATKAGVIGMTKVWARELGKKGINVNAVAPGFIETDMVKLMPENVLVGMRDKTPLGRLGQPEDIANAYLFLASEEASYINGTVLSVDGGLIS